MNDMRLVVAGASGRMGRILIKTIHDAPGAKVVAALEVQGSIALGQDAGLLAGCGKLNVSITDDPMKALAEADGLIDFTVPGATVAFAKLTAHTRIAHIIGTTGLDEDDLARIKTASRHAVIVRSGNMSLGVNLVAALVARVAKALGPAFDIEILEMHHAMKVDAPSGTALMLGEAAALGRGIDLASHAVRQRDGHTGVRPEGAIGFASLRGGTVVGDHSVIFAGAGERIEITHRAEDRGLFAHGALRAALWARNQKPGLYGMDDVLGLGAA